LALAPLTLFKRKEELEARSTIAQFLPKYATTTSSTFHVFSWYEGRFAEIRFVRTISKPIERLEIDDSESRRMIWQTLFPTEPMPKVEENAVEKYSGLLDKFLPENVPLDKVMQRVKRG